MTEAEQKERKAERRRLRREKRREERKPLYHTRYSKPEEPKKPEVGGFKCIRCGEDTKHTAVNEGLDLCPDCARVTYATIAAAEGKITPEKLAEIKKRLGKP